VDADRPDLTLPERAEARAGITTLLYRYAECTDLGDLEGVAALFARATYRAVLPDGEIAVIEGADAVLGLLQAMVQLHDGVPGTRHVTTNPIIELAPDGSSATCRSYYTVVQALPDFPARVIIAGRYHDRFEPDADGEGWHFVDRLIHSDQFGDLTHHLRANPFG